LMHGVRRHHTRVRPIGGRRKKGVSKGKEEPGGGKKEKKEKFKRNASFKPGLTIYKKSSHARSEPAEKMKKSKPHHKEPQRTENKGKKQPEARMM